LTSVSRRSGNTAIASNNFNHDNYVRLSELSDQSGRKIGLEYNKFGEPIKFVENGNDLITKTVERNQNSVNVPGNGNLNNIDKLTENRYREVNSSDTTELFIDRHGRALATKDGTHETRYIYQNVSESRVVAKVRQIFDPYSGQTHTYDYDNDNEVFRYNNTAGNGRSMSVRQSGANDIEYFFQTGPNTFGTHTAAVRHQDSVRAYNRNVYIDPRVIETRDGGHNEFAKTYSYDDIGRLENISSETEGETLK